MKKANLFVLTFASLLALSSCGGAGQEQSSSLKQEDTSVSTSSEETLSSSDLVSSSEESVDDSWSEEKKTALLAVLEVAKTAEEKVTAITVTNKASANEAAKTYGFEKGHDKDDQDFCIVSTSNSETYYFYQGSTLRGITAKHSGEDTTYSVVRNPSASAFDGIDMSAYMLTPSYEKKIYGGLLSLTKMVGFGIDNPNKDTKIILKEDGFSMSYMFEKSAGYYIAEIQASIGKDGLISSFSYRYNMTYKSKVDLHEDGTFSLKEDANVFLKETTYSAVAGEEKELSLPIAITNLEYHSYDIYAGDTRITNGGSANVGMTNYGVELDIRNIEPSTALLDLDPWTITVTDENGATDRSSNYFDVPSHTLVLSAIGTGGTYQVSIVSKHIEMEFTLHVTAPTPTNIVFYGLEATNYGMAEALPKTAMAIGTKTNLMTSVEPMHSSQEVTIEITTSEGLTESDYTWTPKTYSNGGMVISYFEFSPSKPGVYTFTATSVANPAVTATHVITASGTLNKDQVFSGKYCFQSAGQLVYTFEFEPNSASAVQGDGKVKITNANSGTYGYYKYVSSGTNGVRLTYDSTVTGSVEDFYETTITSDGTRDSLVVHYKDSPVGWAATMKLTDWSVYEASIA